MDDGLPPPSLALRLAAATIVGEHGRLVAGGFPFRMLRLTPAGAHLVAGWRDGAPIGDRAPARRLARTLLEAGLADPDPPPRATLDDLAIVVPVRDQAEQLDRCLAALRDVTPADTTLVVVDDGSADRASVAAAAARRGAALVRHDEPRGPAAARNSGVMKTDQRLVAFVDADVVVQPGCLQRLAAHLDDPRVGAAAPRVLGLCEEGVIGGYEATRSSLDMGAAPAAVAPGRPVSYVPSTTLAVRRAALPQGGFDETLHIGEDVDLVWRMHAGGHRIVYDPTAAVRHEHRTRPLAFLQRRWAYARSIGLLARRHPDALPAWRTDPLTAVAATCLAAGRPFLALTLAELRIAQIRRVLAAHTDEPDRLAATLSWRYGSGSLRGAGHAIRRAWSPLVVLAAIRRRGAWRLLLGAYAVRLLEPAAPRRPGDLLLDIVDDAVAAAGTWSSCIEHRTLRPLLISFRPPRARAPSDQDPGWINN